MADPRMIVDSAFAMACPLDVACTKHYNALCCLPFELDACTKHFNKLSFPLACTNITNCSKQCTNHVLTK